VVERYAAAMSHQEANHDGPLAEFAALRAEILQSFQAQWNSFALQLTATAVIFSFSLSNTSRTGFLLILPVITYALSRQYQSNTAGIQRIAKYIMEELSPRVPGGLRWEEWLRQYLSSGGQRSGRLGGRLRIGLHLPFPSIFPMVSMAAIAWTVPYILFSNHVSDLGRGFLIVICLVDSWLTGVSFYSIKQEQKLYSSARRTS